MGVGHLLVCLSPDSLYYIGSGSSSPGCQWVSFSEGEFTRGRSVRQSTAPIAAFGLRDENNNNSPPPPLSVHNSPGPQLSLRGILVSDNQNFSQVLAYSLSELGKPVWGLCGDRLIPHCMGGTLHIISLLPPHKAHPHEIQDIHSHFHMSSG